MTTYHPDTTYTPSYQTNGQDRHHSMADTARETFDQARTHVRDTTEAARRQVSTSTQNVSSEGAKFVRENPALALAGAAGIGILLGIALRGR
ncbi:hypothetical protein ACG74X_11635 [Marivita sp. S0852]|uniref:hypothetical protein n=1 Tax=Marivita sp. S0852 TaxID=3373893 RepID=UPI003982361F